MLDEIYIHMLFDFIVFLSDSISIVSRDIFSKKIRKLVSRVIAILHTDELLRIQFNFFHLLVFDGFINYIEIRHFFTENYFFFVKH